MPTSARLARSSQLGVPRAGRAPTRMRWSVLPSRTCCTVRSA